jgi:N-acetylglucosaminyldiphosphoundecaprenol N-acetyl-beta-D-mannosaminyltransferase
MRINTVDLRAFLQIIDERIAAGEPGYVVTPNVDHVCNFDRDKALMSAYEGGMLVVADSTPLMWAARLLGAPLPQKLSGSDLIYWLCEHAEERGHAIFLLGAAEGVANEAAQNLVRRYPDLRIAGTYSPPNGFERDETALLQIQDTLQSAHAAICFVAFGSPKQEIWMHRYAATCGIPIVIGIGASLDFVAGRVLRAPRVLQRSGLEWAWRLSMEPRRLWRRYLVNDRRFFSLVIAEWWRKRRQGGRTGDKKESCSDDTGI